jgi:hypothetical protein
VSAALEARGGGVHEKADWHAGMPGTYGLVIGVSDYTYLCGDATYGLNKLYVSALTAYRFFEWLRDQFGFRGTPLVKCWLLLAPTAAEITVEPALASAGGLANFDNCAAAINEWYDAVKAVTQDSEGVSGSTFFFSGHGFQVTKQLLLPCDYLHPKKQSVNRAISTANVYDALLYTTVKRHFLFVDACRNDTSKLRTADQSIIGERILNVPFGTVTPRTEGFEKILYASAVGEQTWQLNDVSANEGMSFYGRALVNGLREEQHDVPLPLPDKSRDPWAIPFENLFQYMAAVLSDQLKPHGIYTANPIVEDGARQSPEPPVVAHVPHAEGAIGTDTAGRGDYARSVAETLFGKARDAAAETLYVVTGFFPFLGSAGAHRGITRATDYLSSVAIRKSAEYTSLLAQSDNVQHDAFGSERVTGFFDRPKIFDITAGRGVDEPLAVRRVERSEDARAHVTVVRLPETLRSIPEHRVWIEFRGDNASFAFIIPAAPMAFRVKTIRRDDQSLSIVSLQVDLGEDLSPILDEAAELLSRAGTVTKRELAQLERNLRTVKLATPGAHLAAAMSAWLRSACGSLAGIRNKTYARFAEAPASSDLLVVELEYVMATDPARHALYAKELVQKISRLGAPVLSSVEDMLLNQIHLLAQAELTTDWQDVRNALQQSFAASLSFHRTGGTFSTYAYTERALARAWEDARAALQQRQMGRRATSTNTRRMR